LNDGSPYFETSIANNEMKNENVNTNVDVMIDENPSKLSQADDARDERLTKPFSFENLQNPDDEANLNAQEPTLRQARSEDL